MRKITIFLMLMVISVFAIGCNSEVITPIETTINADDLCGNYNASFDFNSFTGDLVTVKFYDQELYNYIEGEGVKVGQTILYNNGQGRLKIKTIETFEKPIKGTDLTYECMILNDQLELRVGSGYFYLIDKDTQNGFYRETGETKTLHFSDDFVFYPKNSGEGAIYDPKEAMDYLKAHPELNYQKTDVAIDDDEILAIRNLPI